MLGLWDQLELDALVQTGDLEQAQAIGHAAREATAILTDIIADVLGLGPVFSAEMAARLP